MANSHVSFSGNLTADPVLRSTSQGKPVANFTVAVSEGSKDNPQTGFYDVTVWDTLAQNAADSLRKGARVNVLGILHTGTWVTKEGENRSKVQITADAVGPDLRFATAQVVPNTRPTVPAAQQQYPTNEEWAGQPAPTAEGLRQAGAMSDEEWAARRSTQGAPVVSDEPF